MPWPMVHFLIATKIYSEQPSIPFLLGSIAPDTPLATNRKDKGKTHLFSSSGMEPNVQSLMEFFTKNSVISKDPDFHDFLLGYISHIYSDMRWKDWKKPFSHISKSILDTEENGMDFSIYERSCLMNNIETKIDSARLFELPGLYLEKDLNKWRTQIFNWLHDKSNKPDIQPMYITKDFVSQFVQSVSRELLDMHAFVCPKLTNEEKVNE